jgi:DNA-binding winged helix-turn-helix (wHTH) protein
MALRLEQSYELGEFLLEPGKRLLSLNGEPVRLSKLPFRILLYLIEHRDRVVTRRELLQEFWGGQGIYEDPLRKKVYEDTLRKSVGAVRKALGDGNGGRPRYVETCRGEGYRYVGPFRESPPAKMGGEDAPPAASFRAPDSQHVGLPDAVPSHEQRQLEQAPSSPPLPAATRRTIRKWATSGPLLAVALSVAALAVYQLTIPLNDTGGSAQRPKPRSVAVLPLRNLTEDPANEYLCDGVTESLINALSRVDGLKVVARGSAFSLKGREVDPRELGRRLGVSSVLQGSLSAARMGVCCGRARPTRGSWATSSPSRTRSRVRWRPGLNTN